MRLSCKVFALFNIIILEDCLVRFPPPQYSSYNHNDNNNFHPDIIINWNNPPVVTRTEFVSDLGF